MPRASTKHLERMNVLNFADFSGGEVYGVSPESLSQNELQVLQNFEYDSITGHPKCTRVFEEFCDVGAVINDVYVNGPDDYFLAACGANLKKVPISTATPEDIAGVLAGSKAPSFDLWDQNPRKVLIASGGKLQTYDGSTLTTLSDSPDCDIVFVRAPAGRVVVSRSSYDKLVYSSVGDCESATAWTIDPADDSAAKELEVGYKDSGDIVTIEAMPSDIAVFKDSGRIFRVIGEYPDWEVKEIQSRIATISKDTAVRVANDVLFLTNEGLRALSVVAEYGDMLQKTVSENVDQYLARVLTSAAKIWYIPTKGQVLINPNGSSVVRMLHMSSNKAWSHIVFDGGDVTKMFEHDDEIYLVSGTKIYRQALGSVLGDEEKQAVMRLKKVTFDHDIILKRIVLNVQPETTSYGSVMVAGTSMVFDTGNLSDYAYEDDDYVYEDTDPIYIKGEQAISKRCNIRTDVLEPELIVSNGNLTVRKLTLYYAEG